MFILGYFLMGIAEVLNIVLYTYLFIIIARAVLSWVNPDPWNSLVRFLYQVTEPLLERIRRIPPLSALSGGGMDFSPIVVILVIVFLQQFLVNSLVRIAQGLIH